MEKPQRKILNGRCALRLGENFQMENNRGINYLMPRYKLDNGETKWEEMTQEPQKGSKPWPKLEVGARQKSTKAGHLLQ